MNLITESVCLFISFYVINGLFAKDLHVKKDDITRFNDGDFFEIFQDEHFIENRRSARHMKAVTESILDHILQEFKKTVQHTPQRRNKKKLVQKFKEKLKKHAKKHRKTKHRNTTISNQWKKVSTPV